MLPHRGMGGQQLPLQLLSLVIIGDCVVIVLLAFEKVGQLFEARAQAFAVEGGDRNVPPRVAGRPR